MHSMQNNAKINQDGAIIYLKVVGSGEIFLSVFSLHLKFFSYILIWYSDEEK